MAMPFLRGLASHRTHHCAPNYAVVLNPISKYNLDSLAADRDGRSPMRLFQAQVESGNEAHGSRNCRAAQRGQEHFV